MYQNLRISAKYAFKVNRPWYLNVPITLFYPTLLFFECRWPPTFFFWNSVNWIFFRAFYWVKITRLSSNQSLHGFFLVKSERFIWLWRRSRFFCHNDFAMIFSKRPLQNTLTSKTRISVQSVKSYDISVTKFQNHYIHCVSRNKQ
jgi:hypothetical protein